MTSSWYALAAHGCDNVSNFDLSDFRISPDFAYTNITTTSVTKDLHLFPPKAELSHPLTVPNYDLGLIGTFKLRLSYFNFEIHPSVVLEGYSIAIHDPFEVPTAFLNTVANQTISLGIIPHLLEFDESIESFSADE